MKKIIPGFVCLLLITSCGFEMPESLTVKGKPGLYISLGSPFARMKDEDRLENLISTDNIKKMLSGNAAQTGAGSELIIYEVDETLTGSLGIEKTTQTYLVRYPLAEMPLDLKQYTDKAMEAVNNKKQFTIPSMPVAPSLSRIIYLIEDGYTETPQDPIFPEPNNKPFIKIPLADMAKLVKRVEAEPNGVFGLEVAYDSDLANNLELNIPGLGFDWMKGVPVDADGNPNPPGTPAKLRYYNPTKKIFYPRDEIAGGVTINKSDLSTGGNLYIYARISGPLQQQKTYTPSLVFEWDHAIIDTISGTENKGSFSGEYPINNKLNTFLGEGVSFKQADGYIYLSGAEIGKASSITFSFYGASDVLLDSEFHTLGNVEPPTFPSGGIFTSAYGDMLLNRELMSLTDRNTVDMLKLLDPKCKKLKVDVQIPEMTIRKTDDIENKAIKFDMLILVPLDLKVIKPIPDGEATPDIQSNYVMLDLGNKLNKKPQEGEEGEEGEESDLFGRKPGPDADNALKSIDYMDIGITKLDINIIDPKKLVVLVKTKKDNGRLLAFKNNESLRFPGEALNDIPFNPKFTVLLIKDEGQNFGSFKVLRLNKPRFDFKLWVKARAALEYTLDL